MKNKHFLSITDLSAKEIQVASRYQKELGKLHDLQVGSYQFQKINGFLDLPIAEMK